MPNGDETHQATKMKSHGLSEESTLRCVTSPDATVRLPHSCNYRNLCEMFRVRPLRHNHIFHDSTCFRCSFYRLALSMSIIVHALAHLPFAFRLDRPGHCYR